MTATSPRPPRSTPDVASFPAPLRDRDQWAAFRYGLRDGAWTKVPKQPNGRNARSNDPSTWSSFRAALAAFKADRTLDGVGYFFSEDDPYCFIDIDKVKASPERLTWALDIVRRFDTYAEWSVSGNGLHLVGEGRMPDVGAAVQQGRNDRDKGLEAYSRRRFATFTGQLVEDATTAIVDVQAQLDRLLAHEFKPVGAGRTDVKLARSAAAAPIGDRDQRARERMYAARRGDQVRQLADGGSLSGDLSGDDLSYANALAFWLDKDPARMAAELWRSGRVRDKWHERHSADGRTYLELTIGKAIASCSQSFRDLTGYDAGDEPPGSQQRPEPAEPVAPGTAAPSGSAEPTTLEAARAEIARLRRRALDQDDRIEMLAGIIDDQQQVIAATRDERDQLAELRAIDRRAELARQRIRRAFKPGQADAIVAVATIAPPLANAHQTDAPIVTRAMVAEASGCHAGTAGENLKVFDLPGSPIRRVARTLGTKELTAYQLDGMNAADILERMADLGERLDRSAPTRAKRVRCKDHPQAGTVVNTVCAACGALLDTRHVAPAPVDNVSETRALEDDAPRVDVPVTYQTRNACVAGPEPDYEGRAAAVMASGEGREVDHWKTLAARVPVDFEAIREARRQAPDPPAWLAQWDDQPSAFEPPPVHPTGPPPEDCARPGCSSPLGPGDRLLCVEHRAEAGWPAVAGGET